MSVEVGVAQRSMIGQSVCGDGYVILDGPPLLVGVVDGLGHGPEAAEASIAFCSYLRDHTPDNVDRALRGVDRAMASTRGGMGAVIRVDTERRRLWYGAVGNIGMQGQGTDAIRPISTSGILGKSARKLRVFEYELTGPHTLYIYSDGISSRFDPGGLRGLSPQRAADALLRDFGKAHDDATVVVLSIDPLDVSASRVKSVEPLATSLGPNAIRQEFDAVWCSRDCSAFARSAGFSAKPAWEIAIVVSELVKNAARHAGAGTIIMRRVDGVREGVEIVVEDDGPGIPDVSAAMRDGYSGGRMLMPEEVGRKGRGLGSGLGAVGRLMDEIEIENKPTSGLRVTARKWLK
jgi:phosphoserine phosphatase RsbX